MSLTSDLRLALVRHLELETLLEPESTPSRPDSLSPTPVSAAATPSLLSPHSTHTRPSLQPVAQHQATVAYPELIDKFYRMLSLNRRIIGETDLERLIPTALDIALELSGAERGFLLLCKTEGGPFEVAFSRDVDGRPIPRAHLEISATVARQVAEQGVPVLTADAGLDRRFGQAASIHQLKLTSILCVPIQDRERVLGCLYLDHRQQPGIFGGHIPRMINAFADQVAIALLSARRIAELYHERDELTRAQRQIKALLAEKEEMLLDLETRCDRLEADLARERSASGLRYDYDNIVAQAPRMRSVLAQLDRVVDTTLPIVVQGESGTGKEVIARAVHFQGSRRERPFVAINCGALAEQLLESELFGHKRGSFTGADVGSKGFV